MLPDASRTKTTSNLLEMLQPNSEGDDNPYVTNNNVVVDSYLLEENRTNYQLSIKENKVCNYDKIVILLCRINNQKIHNGSISRKLV